jgi:rod shape-determining protein MreC
MYKRPHYIALGVVVLLTLTIVNLPSQTKARLKLGIGSLFLPLFGLTTFAREATGHASEALLTRGQLQKQNEDLRRENQDLRLRADRVEDIERENNRLRQLLGWQQRQPAQHHLARVILREPANWWRTIQINLGGRDGVQTNMAVLSGDGFLVGRVSSVSLTKSQVVLLGDPTCKVSVRVENEKADAGVIGASGPLESEFVEMALMSKNANVKPGQIVKSSGYGGMFPPDIPIGKVVDTHPADYGLTTVARVKIEANLNGLQEVWVRYR